MEKYSVDYNELCSTVDQPKAYRLDDVKDKIEKVAFDVVRFRDNDDTDQLWRIDEREDGPVIVALYDEATGSIRSESTEEKNWEALPDKSASCVHVYYKGEPIVRLAAEDLGIPQDEVELAARWLPDRLAEDEDIKRFVMSKIGESARKLVVEAHPELNVPTTPTKMAKMAQEVLGKAEGDVHNAEDIPLTSETRYSDPRLEALRKELLERMNKAIIEFAKMLRARPSKVRAAVEEVMNEAKLPFEPMPSIEEPAMALFPEEEWLKAAALVRQAVEPVQDPMPIGGESGGGGAFLLKEQFQRAVDMIDVRAREIEYTVKESLRKIIDDMDLVTILERIRGGTGGDQGGAQGGGKGPPKLSLVTSSTSPLTKVASKLVDKYGTKIGKTNETT
jgi:hypothetical protein